MSKSQRKKQQAESEPRRAMPVTHMTLSPGPTIHCDGKVWRLGFNTQDAKGRLEELIRGHVVREALKTKRLLGGADGDEVYESRMDKVDCGHYRTFADGWRKILKTPTGSALFLLSLLQHHHPDATEDDARRLLMREHEQTEAAIVAISPDFFGAMAVQMGASPADAPAVAAAVAAELATAVTPEPATGSAS